MRLPAQQPPLSALVAFFAAALLLLSPSVGRAQQTNAEASRRAEIRELRAQLNQLNARLARLENEDAPPASSPASSAASSPASPSQPAAALGEASAGLTSSSSNSASPAAAEGEHPVLTRADRSTLDFLNGTTFNVGFDGYYAYDFNSPIGRVIQLRAYTVSSNSFSINQASFVVEHAPNLAQNQRLGARVDLQYGQATETLQGSPQNELRPQVYRNLFQAYGTYVLPVGSGLTFDFGKWSSALGVEGNYTKDQINYSRGYLFDFLPFYHMGARASYNFTPKVNLTYWLVNGAQQTEDFNGFKSQAFLLNWKPASTLSWNVNYYFGQEGRDVATGNNPGLPTGLPQPGLPTSNITPAPNGREHIVDSYATWNATPKLTLVGEGDYVVNRTYSESAPQHVSAGAAYARYQLTPAVAAGARFEYLSDANGLFSGSSQALKEGTLTLEHKLNEGFLVRAEWRRDYSNRRYFLTDTTGDLSKVQSTATVGLVWWAGQKQGPW